MNLEKTLTDFRCYLRDHEHWLFITDREAERAIVDLAERFYIGAGPDDFRAVTFTEPLHFSIVAARKSWAPAKLLKKFLRRYTPETPPADCARDVFILTQGVNLPMAEKLIVTLLETADLAEIAAMEAAA